MRLLVFDRDGDSTDALVALLARNGHEVQRAPDPAAAPDVVIVGLPAPPGLTPESAPDAPLLLLLDGRLPVGDLEAWIAQRTHWALLSKPIRESALASTLARIARAPDEKRLPRATPGVRR